MAIILRKFNLNYIKDSSFIYVIGIAGSGKSMITKDILYYHSDIPAGIAIFNCAKSKNSYNYIPPIFLHEQFNKKIVKRFIKNQVSNSENEEYDSRSFFILEQFMIEYKWNKDKYLQYLYENYANLNALCIIEQHEIDIKEDNVNNIDYIFILKTQFDINKQKIYKKIEKIMGIDYSLFCKFMDDYTHNYNCLVLDVKSKSKNIQDKLYWFKAENHNYLRLCCKESWEYNNNNLIKDVVDINENYIQKIYKRELFY
jgi:hypothetical protein